MMHIQPKFESEEAARSQVERLENQPRMLFGCHDCRWLSFQKLKKQFWREGWQSHKPCARRQTAL